MNRSARPHASLTTTRFERFELDLPESRVFLAHKRIVLQRRHLAILTKPDVKPRKLSNHFARDLILEHPPQIPIGQFVIPRIETPQLRVVEFHPIEIRWVVQNAERRIDHLVVLRRVSGVHFHEIVLGHE